MFIIELKLEILIFFFFSFLIFEKINYYYNQGNSFLKHDKSNLAIMLFNTIIFNSFFNYVFFLTTSSRLFRKYGVFQILKINYIIKGILIILLLDFWTYFWHRLNHEMKFLRKFHKVHHTDTMMNVTTAVRFHFIEFLLSFLMKTLIILILGISLKYLIVYEIIMNICVYFHHSNIKINKKVDNILNKIIVTPYMHRVHHSIIKKERNSNYSALLSIWDKIFNTYTYKEDIQDIIFGLEKYQDKKYDTFIYMLITPFK
ncbi:fatty acid hydroxylase family protein [Hypnocyclicus thermotrophus]|uniref:Fatty acid hydroxylase family protein n=1 Tax=Hypnocyclicus thermotrophus TaxID=1627895 RepID=A0AA46DZH7_9FUSO|nr:sterol desaturase family protein [Hypnocyclicus thermotrophus]TDT71763.1 fatty acid hydroxylase family protein [Hypnocyclicus thermotrophus]